MLQKIEAARNKYKPEHVKLLFIAEAPPEAFDRFFYYEKVQKHDWLYLGIAKVFTNIKDTKFLRAKKSVILNAFKDYGIYLMDLSDQPSTIGLYTCEGKEAFLRKIRNEKAIDKRTTKVILIKASVFDFIYSTLRNEGYDVSNVRIPFPASGQQLCFDIAMRKALKNSCIDVEAFTEMSL